MLECDLIMKGGITSGVVYPHAIAELATRYRFRNIGGTSAGAIGAVFAAAAEYRRQRGAGSDMAGFEQIRAVADELGSGMGDLFQPTPELQPLFELLLAAVADDDARDLGETPPGHKLATMAGAVFRVFPGRLAVGAFIAAAGIVLGLVWGNVWLALLFVLVGILCSVGLIVLALYRLVFRRLPANDFGICPGLTISEDQGPGFSDWIADKIDEIAGNLDPDGRPGPPLTVGQLAGHAIGVATMSTDLSSARPYQLPLRTEHHYFSKREFERLFPARIVDYLCAAGGPRDPRPEDAADLPRDLHRLPAGDDFPVLLVARMSLSFPGLICAVPLYRVDYQLRSNGHAPMRRCLFSDGGISSNFPIHFFDALLPRRPTFGIALGAWDEARHGDERIDLPVRGRQSTHLPVNAIGGIADFVIAIFSTAKDWQDTMQSLLPGYAERIVTVRLDENCEGGLNLTMGPTTIKALAEHGRDAGQRLLNDFNMDQHRYDRAISLFPELEGSLAGLAEAHAARPAGAPDEALTYADVLTEYETLHHTGNSQSWRRDPFARLAEDLAALGHRARMLHDDPAQKSVRQGDTPSIDAQVRLVAITDRVPRDAASGES